MSVLGYVSAPPPYLCFWVTGVLPGCLIILPCQSEDGESRFFQNGGNTACQHMAPLPSERLSVTKFVQSTLLNS